MSGIPPLLPLVLTMPSCFFGTLLEEARQSRTPRAPAQRIRFFPREVSIRFLVLWRPRRTSPCLLPSAYTARKNSRLVFPFLLPFSFFPRSPFMLICAEAPHPPCRVPPPLFPLAFLFVVSPFVFSPLPLLGSSHRLVRSPPRRFFSFCRTSFAVPWPRALGLDFLIFVQIPPEVSPFRFSPLYATFRPPPIH